MTVNDTVIPSRIDSTAVDDVTVSVTSNSKLQLKPTFEQNNIATPIAQHEIEIIELQANASITPTDHDTMISDTFSDTTGLRNTVQTGTTTATFNTNKYQRNNTTIDNDSGYNASANTGAGNTKEDFIVAGTGTYTLKELNFTLSGGGSMAVTVELKDVTETTTLKSWTGSSFVNGINTLTCSDCPILNKGTHYRLIWTDTNTALLGNTSVFSDTTNGITLADVGGSTRIRTHGVAGSTEPFMTISEAGTQSTKIIDISLGTISGTVTHTELVCSCPERETGDGVTYKLKNATQNDDSLALNTKNALVNLTTVPTGIEIQLAPKSSSPTTGYPSCKTFCLKLWKA